MSQLSEAPQAKENLEASKLTNPKDVGVDEGLNSLNEDPKEKFDDLVKDLKNLAWNTNNINYINMLWKKNELSRSNYWNVQTWENWKLLNIKQTLSSGLVTENKLVLLDNWKFLLYEWSYTKEQVWDDWHGNKTTPSTKQVEKVNDKNVDKFLSNFERKINNRQKNKTRKTLMQ